MLEFSIQELLGSAATAVAASSLFVLLAGLAAAIGQRVGNGSGFSGSLLHGPGHYVREELEEVQRQFFVLLGALALVPILGLAILIVRPRLFEGHSSMLIQVLLLLAVLGVIGYGIYLLIRLVRTRGRLRFDYVANIAVGQALQRIIRRGYTVFHDVAIAKTNIENVLVGNSGVYAIVTVSRKRARRYRDKSVDFNGQELSFPDRDITSPVKRARYLANGLSNELSKAIGKQVRVIPGLVVAGWDVKGRSDCDMPAVSEKNVDLLTAWTQPDAYLLDEEQERICNLLTQRCLIDR